MHDIGMEEWRVLRNHSDTLPHTFQCHLTDILIVDEDSSRIGFVKAEEETKYCRFAATGGSDDGDLFAGGNFEGEIAEDGAVGMVAEVDLLEANSATP